MNAFERSEHCMEACSLAEVHIIDNDPAHISRYAIKASFPECEVDCYRLYLEKKLKEQNETQVEADGVNPAN